MGRGWCDDANFFFKKRWDSYPFFVFLCFFLLHLYCDGRGRPAGAASFHWVVSLVCLRIWYYLQQGLDYSTNKTPEGFETVCRSGNIPAVILMGLQDFGRHHFTPDSLIPRSAQEEDK